MRERERGKSKQAEEAKKDAGKKQGESAKLNSSLLLRLLRLLLSFSSSVVTLVL